MPAALRTAAGLLADPFAVLAAHRLAERELSEDAIGAIGWACAQAGVAIEVTERWRTRSVRSAALLARAGATLVAGSGARTAAEVGRWDRVSAVAARWPTRARPGDPR